MLENIYKDIVDNINNGNKVCMVSSITKSNGEMDMDLHKELAIEGVTDSNIRDTLEEGVPRFIEDKHNMLMEPFYPEERLIVLGAGHLAIPLVDIAAKTGFSITVVDDRLSFANALRFPLAKQVICDGFQHAIETLDIKQTDYVIIITRGHRYDSDCLKSICLGLEPRYVGMIGSRRRTTIVKETLEEQGCNKERLNKVHTPIGLNIGAITPEEIAISIVAELISHKRLGLSDFKKGNRSDIDYEVLQVLALETDVPKAIISVIKTKGSVPRGAGAKMIVYEDGKILGSIGGGCSEAAVIGQARKIIGSNKYKIVEIDLTGEAAEEEGMVCGGVMTVLLEDYKTSYSGIR